MKSLLFILVALLYTVAPLNNGLGLTPPMGWNSWNKFNCRINEQLIKDTADSLVKTGLAGAGYVYVNLDDCWMVSRDKKSKVIQPDEKAFPSGMKALGDYIHSKGLKYGLYSSSGAYTCCGRPGSVFFEDIDAQTYTEWGVDYLKYDNCFTMDLPHKWRYTRMRDALNKTGRAMYYSVCNWGIEEPWTWAGEVGNSWRTTGDIHDNWDEIVAIINNQAAYADAGHPGAWNDPDMLEVGNGNMTVTEYESHFTLWAVMKAPLIIGCDIVNMSPDTFRILSNKEIIAVNQDSLGKSALRLKHEGDSQIWAGPVADGYVVTFFNTGKTEATIKADLSLFGLSGKQNVRDLWKHTDLAAVTGSIEATVASHGVVVYKLTPSKEAVSA